MADIMDPRGGFITWEDAHRRGIPSVCRNAFLKLVTNLVQFPDIENSVTLQNFYVEGRAQSERCKFGSICYQLNIYRLAGSHS